MLFQPNIYSTNVLCWVDKQQATQSIDFQINNFPRLPYNTLIKNNFIFTNGNYLSEKLYVTSKSSLSTSKFIQAALWATLFCPPFTSNLLAPIRQSNKDFNQVFLS
jgi:hypothetical protein